MKCASKASNFQVTSRSKILIEDSKSLSKDILKAEYYVKIGILSNCDEHEVKCLARSPLLTLVDATDLSVYVRLMKPDPAFYLNLLNRLGISSPSEAIFVGDGESDELIRAKTLGFRLVFFLKQFVTSTSFHSEERMKQFDEQSNQTLVDIRQVISYV